MEFSTLSNSQNVRGPSEATIKSMPRLSTASKESKNTYSLVSDPYKVRLGSEATYDRNNSSDR